MGKNNDGGATRHFDTTSPSDLTVSGKSTGQHKKIPVGKTIGKSFSFITNLLLTVLLIAIVTGIMVLSVFAIYIKNNLIEDYDIVGLETNLEQTTKIYYTDELGQQIEMEDQRLHGEENRSWVSISKMPTNLKNAFVAIEDQRFYEHNGMDLKRTAGAVLEFIGGNSSYGGSTITQQLIKNFSGDNDATMQRKIKEIFRAISLTKKRSKDEVLEMYLNTINLSNGCYGVQAAANYLFGKDVSELTLVECASLAAIPKSPYQYNPKSHPEDNKERRNTVLEKMAELEWISQEEKNEALAAEIVLNITEDESGEEIHNVTSYFTDALIEQIIKDLEEEYGYPRKVALNIIFGGGLKIHSTIDPRIQQIMDEVYKDPNTFVKGDGIQPESAMVVLDPYTGDVKGIVGGRGEKTISRGLNRATMSKRQIGSSIKPLTVYAPAMDLGYIDYGTVVDDTPFKFYPERNDYWPSNAGRGYRGKTTINYGIKQSLNTTAVKTLDMITPEYSYYFAKEKLKLHSLVESDCDYAPLALGGLTWGLTVMEVAGAYTMFPNDGVFSEPRLYTVIYDNKGQVLLDNSDNQSVAISQSTAQIMTKIMNNVLTSGTGTAVTLKNKVNTAGKTGSTNDMKDVYFVGYTPYYVGAAWFGYDKPKYIPSSFGNNPALTVWDKVMNRIHDEIVIKEANANGTALKTFNTSEIVQAQFCIDSGKKPTELCKSYDPRGSRVETGWYKKGSVPTEPCDCHVAVDMCTLSGAVANSNCPAADRRTVALVLAEDRNFPINVSVSDTQFTARNVGAGYYAVLAENQPYYAGLMPEGTYPGYNAAESYYNRICTWHTAYHSSYIPEYLLPVIDPDYSGTESSDENTYPEDNPDEPSDEYIDPTAPTTEAPVPAIGDPPKNTEASQTGNSSDTAVTPAE